ncbi:MAG TPA: hypothetical protein VI653_14810 [Steroidobacteraceae bacterium]
MLDQSDTNSKVGAVRHLTHEDLEAYSTGRLAAARSSFCQAHLDSCEACRAELEDLRTFKGELATFSRPDSNPRDLGRSKRRRKLSLPLAASLTIIVVAGGSTVLWTRHEQPQANEVPVARSVVPPAVVSPDVRQPPVAPIASSVRINAAPTPAALSTQHVAMQATATPPSAGTSETNKGFALLGPVGKTISETRPEFTWQSLPGAIRYSVAIVDARLHPVQHSPALRTTVWRPRRPLRRGRTYLWQVTATLRGGAKVVASEPGILTETAPELGKATARTLL